MDLTSFTLATEQGRQRLLSAALNLTENTTLAPEDYERQLLARFVRGELTIEQVLACLEEQEQRSELA